MSLIKFREEIEIVIINDGQEDYIELIDKYSIKINKLTAPIEYLSIIKLIINGVNLKDIYSNDVHFNEINLSKESIDNVIINLERYHFLQSEKSLKLVTEIKNYENSDVRPNICQDSLYSSDPIKFKDEIRKILKLSESDLKSKNLDYSSNISKVILAPHIDFNIGLESLKTYSMAFNNLFHFDFDVVVLLGTAHFKDSGYFMFCDKNYDSPLINLITDKDLIHTIISNYNHNLDLIHLEKEFNKNGILIDNLAHKNEHSLELHTVFLSYILEVKKQQIPIIPILTGSFNNNLNNNESKHFYGELIQFIFNNIKSKYKKILFLCSGDLSHIGKKFGDEYDAIEKLSELQSFELELINILEQANPEQFYEKLNQINQIWKVCGFAPFYAGLKFLELEQNTQENSKENNPQNKFQSKLLNYATWYERQRESAVSFMSMMFS